MKSLATFPFLAVTAAAMSLLGMFFGSSKAQCILLSSVPFTGPYIASSGICNPPPPPPPPDEEVTFPMNYSPGNYHPEEDEIDDVGME